MTDNNTENNIATLAERFPHLLQKEGDYSNWRDNLAPIEHRLIGSTPFGPNDPHKINVDEFLDRVTEGNKEALRKLTTPIFILGNKKPLEDVKKERNLESKKKENTCLGITFIFDTSSSAQLLKGITAWTELNPLSERGTIQTEWKVWFLTGDGKQVENLDSIKGLKLSPTIAKWFRLEDATGESYRLLKLKRLTDQ